MELSIGSDVVLALQLQVLSNLSNWDNAEDRRQAMEDAKAEIPRKIELVVLKNRNGKAFSSDTFDYNPEYNYFLETAESFTKSFI